jgi:hypothetical protein
MAQYKLSKSSINHVLERVLPTRTGGPKELSDQRVDKIIEYLSESWEHRVLNCTELRDHLKLTCTPETLATRLKQRGYRRCTACQKPYLTAAQVIARFLWAITHIFWQMEWLKVLWSDEVTFLVRGRTVKQKVRFCDSCIQHQFHPGGTMPVNAREQLDMGIRVHCYLVKDLAREEHLLKRTTWSKSLRYYSQFWKLLPSLPTNCTRR